MASCPITSWQIDGETVKTVTDFIFFDCKITAACDCSHEVKMHLLLGREAMTNLDSMLKSRGEQRSSQSYGFSSSHLWRWDLDCIESWAPKNWCIWTVVLEKTLESPLNCKVKPVHMKGNQSWIFIGRTGAEAETPVLWPPDSKSWLIGKDPDAGNDWRQEKKGTTEDEMVGWHHWHNEHEFEQALELMMDTEAWRTAVHRVAVRHDWEAALNWCEFIEYKKHPMLMVLSTSFILFLVFSGIWEWNFIFEF